MRQQTHSVSYSWLSDLGQLVKLRLSLMVVLTAILGYMISTAFEIVMLTLSLLAVGGFAVTAGSNILNQVMERDFDRLMKRTAKRPLADQRMNVSAAVSLAGIFCVIGLILLAIIHPLCAILGSVSFVSYTFIYTPLKRTSTWAVAVGAVPGAIPVVIGCIAGSGELTALALVLFILQFLWQFPHFWSIGYLSFDDYKNAGFKLVPSKNGSVDPKIGEYSVLYCLALLALSTWIAYTGLLTSLLAIVLLVGICLGFLVSALRFWYTPNRKTALFLMLSSIAFMPMSLLVFLIDIMV